MVELPAKLKKETNGKRNRKERKTGSTKRMSEKGREKRRGNSLAITASPRVLYRMRLWVHRRFPDGSNDEDHRCGYMVVGSIEVLAHGSQPSWHSVAWGFPGPEPCPSQGAWWWGTVTKNKHQ